MLSPDTAGRDWCLLPALFQAPGVVGQAVCPGTQLVPTPHPPSPRHPASSPVSPLPSAEKNCCLEGQMEELGLMENTSLPGRPEPNEEEPGKIRRHVCETPRREGASRGRGSHVEPSDPACGDGLLRRWLLCLFALKLKGGERSPGGSDFEQIWLWWGSRAVRPSWPQLCGHECTS